MPPWLVVLSILAADPAVAAAGGGSGDLFVKTSIPGARVFLDGADTGQVAPVVLEKVPAGSHVVRAVAGCEVAQASTRVEAGLVTRVELAMDTGDGLLDVAYTPVGSRVFVDGASVGVTPLLHLSLSCGEHRVEVTHPGWRTVAESVRIGLDETVFLKGALGLYGVGTLAILVRPVEAEVRLDDRPVGTGPMTLEDVEAGSHTVAAYLQGYREYATQVTVPEGGVGRTVITLQPDLRQVGPKERGRVAWGHLAADLGLTLTAGGLAAGAVREHGRAAEAYETYKTLTYADDPEAWYESEVRRRVTISWILAGGAGAMALGAVAGWVFLPVMVPASETTGVAVVGRF